MYNIRIRIVHLITGKEKSKMREIDPIKRQAVIDSINKLRESLKGWIRKDNTYSETQTDGTEQEGSYEDYLQEQKEKENK